MMAAALVPITTGNICPIWLIGGQTVLVILYKIFPEEIPFDTEVDCE